MRLLESYVPPRLSGKKRKNISNGDSQQQAVPAMITDALSPQNSNQASSMTDTVAVTIDKEATYVLIKEMIDGGTFSMVGIKHLEDQGQLPKGMASSLGYNPSVLDRQGLAVRPEDDVNETNIDSDDEGCKNNSILDQAIVMDELQASGGLLCMICDNVSGETCSRNKLLAVFSWISVQYRIVVNSKYPNARV